MVIDIGNLIYKKQDIDNINKIVLDYGISNIDKDDIEKEMYTLAKLNNQDITVKIKFIDNEFYIKSTYYVEGIFSNIFNTKGYLITSKYKCYLDSDNKQVIKKIK